MKSYPHHYKVKGTASSNTDIRLTAEGLPALDSAPPLEFDGPGDKWSPESLLTAAVADCFILTFKAIARASKFEWISLQCEVEATLDIAEKVTKFTDFHIQAKLNIAQREKQEMAKRLLEKAESACLITNSLCGETHLKIEVETGLSG